MKSVWVAVALLLVGLAGCAEDAPLPRAAELARHDVHGQVLTPAFNPIPGVRVELIQPGTILRDGTQTADAQIVDATTDDEGRFVLQDVYPGNWNVTFTHTDYEALSEHVVVPGPNVTFHMSPVSRIVPYQAPWPFSGYWECGADHLIFAGSCDEFAGAVVAPAQGATADQREFFFDVDDDWQTIVVDVGEFELPPTLEALRVAAYAPDNDAEVLTYERYAAASDAEPFTLRIEPGGDYGETLIAPEGATTIRLEVFPQGYAYHEACDPAAGNGCFTGIGASGRVDFEMVATVFYHEAAPEGWTLLG